MNAIATERLLGVRLLHRQPVRARDGMAGELADILLDDARWLVRYLVIDDLGPMPRRDVLVQPPQAVLTGDAVRLSLSREELKHCPDLDADRPVYLQYDMHGAPRAADPHLRSAEIMLGFAVRERGTAAGRLRDIEIDADQWKVASLLVDSGIWLQGQRRVVMPADVRSIDWIARTIELR